MPLFDVPSRSNRASDKRIARLTTVSKSVPTAVRGGGILDKVNKIREAVNGALGQYADNYIIIRDRVELEKYQRSILKSGIVAVDTETTGLDPMRDGLVGVCLYTPGAKGAYVPMGHISYVTGERLVDQVDVSVVKSFFETLIAAQVDIIMFNAKFDVRFLRNQAGVSNIYCTWDCYLAARLMNENEEHSGLKALHQKYVMDGHGDAFSFDALFNGITFDRVPVEVGYMYAAHDAEITYQLYEYQKQFMYYDPDESNEARNGMNGVSWVFFNIEMPCIRVVCDMEDAGVKFDFEYQKKLSVKYNRMMRAREEKFYTLCAEHQSEIDAYKQAHPDHKLETPINIASPAQIAVLLYDVLRIAPPDSKNPRSTGSGVLQKMKSPIVDAILDYREAQKLVSTYIDKLPECVNPNDGRIHCSFNQYGADTGRFSSSNPNLQNIPSHNKEIRQMFRASDGCVLMSSDYSQQEPKVMTQMCGDPKMIQAYKEGKDLYAEIAALSFNTTYDNCLEFRPDGTTNPEGKNRRSQAKSILLGVLYGRGVPSIAEQLGTTTEKAQVIKDSVFMGFPAIPRFERDSLDMAYSKGYVTTLWGRKRRLPDLQLPEYEFRSTSGDWDVPEELEMKYLRKLRNVRFGQKRRIFEEANAEGVWIIDNGGKIADAQRQCVNARIQGSAADMSKLAMIAVGNDRRLHELGFRLLIPVHDELIGECPEENAKECAERFAELMSKAAESRLSIPIKCDVEVTRCWYGEVVEIE